MIVFIADRLERLDPAVDTTVGMMHAAQDADHAVWVTEATALDVDGGDVRAHARRIHLAPSSPAGDHRWSVPDPWVSIREERSISLSRAEAVLMRTDPPVDDTYRTATLLLDLIDPATTAVVNDPRGLRLCNEKLYALNFPDLVPTTLVSADEARLRGFVEHVGVAVAKPVEGCGGRGVVLLDHRDANLPSLIELMCERGRRATIVQRYLPEVSEGNKRIYLLDGEPVGAVLRFPRGDDFRIGEPGSESTITERDREICARLAPSLARDGLRVVGLDVIGDHLIEINVTSPGALRKADGLLGWTLCADVIDAVLHHRHERSAA